MVMGLPTMFKGESAIIAVFVQDVSPLFQFVDQLLTMLHMLPHQNQSTIILAQ
jgi:hypothetical protein